MEKSFNVQLLAYAPLLRSERIFFREDNRFLFVGAEPKGSYWALYISCKTLETMRLLNDILPLLKGNGLTFRLVKNQLVQYQLNSGAFGVAEVGKVIGIYATNTELVIKVAKDLCEITQTIQGPVIPGVLRLSRAVYAQWVDHHQEHSPAFSVEEKNKCLPFKIPNEYRAVKKRKAIIGGFYVPVELLGCSPKGDIYKAINLKRLAFNWCLVKQGNPVALDDHFERDMKDRLLWQREVLRLIANAVRTPAALDYFEQHGASYLVMQFVDGQPLGKLIFDLLNGTTWKNLKTEDRRKLLGYYLQALDIVQSIHEQHVVHRDITDSNFLVDENGEVCIIDFELSYHMDQQRPSPPFVLGTFGYAAPEQLQYAMPDYTEDIYSLGALLCYLFSGSQPTTFLKNNKPGIIVEKLCRLTGNTLIAKLVARCLHSRRSERPGISEVKEVLTNYLTTLN